MHSIDATDRKILDLLQKDGRMTNAALAETLGLTATPTLQRVRKLEEAGIIQGYVALVDRAALGQPTMVWVQVTLQEHQLSTHTRFVDAVTSFPEVLEVHHVAGQDSYLAKVRVKDPEALGRLLRERFGAIPGVRSTMSTIALETLKEHWSLPIEPLPVPEKERLRA